MPALFRQVLDPAHNLGLTSLLALVPVVALLVMLAAFRVTAWLVTVMLSATDAGCRVKFTVGVEPTSSRSPSALAGWKPSSVAVTR